MSVHKLTCWGFIVVLALALMVTQVWALPPLPATFYGLVQENGGNVPDGTIVSASIGGTTYAQTSTQIYQGSSVYTLIVPGDDPTTAIIEGGVDGDLVTFTVAGEPMRQVAVWHAGDSVQLDLGVILCLPIDLDCNRRINIIDIMRVAAHWGARRGDTDYSLAFDFDRNGCIDVSDIMLVASHWREKY